MIMRRHEAQEGFGQRFPGFAGDVVFAETAGDAVEEGAHLVLAFFHDAAGGGAVVGGFGDFLLGASEEVVEDVVSVAGGEAVKAVFADAAVFDQAGLLELGEVGGDGALAHDEDLLQLGDGELFGLEQQEDAEPVGVGYDAEHFDN